MNSESLFASKNPRLSPAEWDSCWRIKDPDGYAAGASARTEYNALWEAHENGASRDEVIAKYTAWEKAVQKHLPIAKKK